VGCRGGGFSPWKIELAAAKAERLHRFAHRGPAGRQPHRAARHQDARDGDGAHEFHPWGAGVSASGVPSTRTRSLIGTDSGCGSRLRLRGQSARLARFQADDPAAADPSPAARTRSSVSRRSWYSRVVMTWS
jgi:hypothetical protein